MYFSLQNTILNRKRRFLNLGFAFLIKNLYPSQINLGYNAQWLTLVNPVNPLI